MDPFEEAELELGLEDGELEGTFPSWLVSMIKHQKEVDSEE